MTPQQIAADLIKNFEGDSGAALDEFTKQSQMKLSSGSVPNEKFTQVSTILEQIATVQDDVDKIAEATKIVESTAFNSMIFERVSAMNKMLGEEVYETPDPLTLTQDVFDYEQALIHVESEIPRIKDAQKRMDTFWVIGQLVQTIDSLKGMNQNVNA